MSATAARLKSCCCGEEPVSGARAASPGERVARAMRWGFSVLGPTLGFYIGIGIVLAAVVGVIAPTGWISSHLGSGSPLLSLLLVALFGASIYVCAVAHIPLVAAMLAAGAGPGAAIVFLVTGAATNLPELIALQRVLGTRMVAVYLAGLVVLSILAGWLVNLWLPDYRPLLDPLSSLQLGDVAERLTPVIPGWLALGSAILVGLLCLWGAGQWLARAAGRLRPLIARPM